MRIIKVATDDASAYYSVVSRLKKTHLRFSSSTPKDTIDPSRELVVTSKKEVGSIGVDAVAIEDLDEDSLIMEGQLLSRLLDESNRKLLIGIDPGTRIGLAMYYGGREFGSLTQTSVEGSVELVAAVVMRVPHLSLWIKIGGGDPGSSSRLARALRERLAPSASIEIVDESGTSTGKRGAIGAARDRRAAARIAFRKGVQFN